MQQTLLSATCIHPEACRTTLADLALPNAGQAILPLKCAGLDKERGDGLHLAPVLCRVDVSDCSKALSTGAVKPSYPPLAPILRLADNSGQPQQTLIDP